MSTYYFTNLDIQNDIYLNLNIKDFISANKIKNGTIINDDYNVNIYINNEKLHSNKPSVIFYVSVYMSTNKFNVFKADAVTELYYNNNFPRNKSFYSITRLNGYIICLKYIYPNIVTLKVKNNKITNIKRKNTFYNSNINIKNILNF